VDLGPSVVADEEPFELVKPGEGALDDPAVAAQAGAVCGAATGDLGCDAAAAQFAPVLVVVVTPVGAQPLRPPARATDAAADGRHPIQQRDQLGDVVTVAAAERPGERDASRVYEKVMLRPGSGSINRARARRGAPFFACTWLPSTTARDHSSSQAARSLASSSSCSRSHTPARCH
jgi:hypothetical protein